VKSESDEVRGERILLREEGNKCFTTYYKKYGRKKLEK
jgi:hypothetical protein